MTPYEVLSDCPHCLTEGAMVELIDPHDHPAVVEARCKMCDYTGREGSGQQIRDASIARQALQRWADIEGLTLHELCTGTLDGPLEDVLQRYASGQPVRSTLDTIAFLFPGMATGSVGAEPTTPRQIDAIKRSPPPVDPHAPARLLVSVMMADGHLRQGERAFVDDFLAVEGLPPIEAHALRPYRPHEVGPIASQALAERTVKAAIELMHLDGQRDGSELRIIRTFARVWGVQEAQVEAWNRSLGRRYTPPLETLWRALSRWVR